MCLLLLPMLGIQAFANDLVVAKDGTGNFTSVQEAINAAPAGRTTPYVIFIKNGVYKEKITVPSTKSFITLIGESVANTILTYDAGASTLNSSGVSWGTLGSASFTVSATDFTAINITFENTFGDGSQAVALVANVDRAAFKNCRFLGNQDTLYTRGTGTRHYFKNCYIDGNVDFIFGSSIALFDDCIVYAKARPNTGSSFITAANTPAGQSYGYVFRNAVLPANPGTTLYALGRPWQNTSSSNPVAHNKTVFINSVMSRSIRPEGWQPWDATTYTDLIYYGEHKSRYFSGELLNTNQRLAWTKQLSEEEAATYTIANMFGDWDPCQAHASLCAATTPEIAVSNFRAAKGATNTNIDFNISWPSNAIKFELFRSSDMVMFEKINELTSLTDTTFNFQFTDALPPAGAKYQYYVQASKEGMPSHRTATVEVSSAPTITLTGQMADFIQYMNGPSATRTYTVAAVNLTSTLAITPPVHYEVTSNGGTTWHTAASPLVLSPVNNTIPATTIGVRLNATEAGSYTGSIVHSSEGAPTRNIDVSGSKVNEMAKVSATLQHWPLTSNQADSAAVRHAGIVASMPTFQALMVSNGTTVAAIPAYSARFGQAFGVTAAGEWGTSSPVNGPGSTLNRNYYEQFTISAAPGQNFRVDSLLLTAAFYNSSSNTRVGIAYSKSGFEGNDLGSEVTAGTGPGGSIDFVTNGGFVKAVPLANQTSSLTNTYRLELAGAQGITLNGGETLTIRLYFSCGSSSAGRYAMLKNIMLKGESLVATSLPFTTNTTTLAVYPNPTAAQAVVNHPKAATGAQIEVYAFNGVKIATIPCEPGNTTTPISIGGFKTGNYLLVYTDQAQRFTTKIIKY